MTRRAKFSVLMALSFSILSCLLSVPRTLAQTADQASVDPPSEDRQASAQKIGQTLDRNLNKDRFLENLRRPIGFSVGANYYYSPDALISSSGLESAEFPSITLRLFAYIQGRRDDLHIDYTFGHRLNQDHGTLDSSYHIASLDFQRHLTRRSSLQISEWFQTGFDDEALTATSSPLNGTLLLDNQAGFSSAAYFRHRPEIRNTLSAKVGVQTGRKGNIYMLMSHNFWHYAGQPFDNQNLQAGIGGSYQINKWMFFESNFTTYVRTTGENLQRNSIQRLQFVGFRYQTKRKIEFSASGSLEFTTYPGENRAAAGIQAGVAKNSNSTRLMVVYHHGFTSAFDQGVVANGHTVVASLDQKLSRRTSFRMQGDVFVDRGALQTVYANAGMSIVLQSHLVGNFNGSYSSQRSDRNFSFSPFIDHYSVSAGVQYFLPSLLGK
jgi:hypothetical protein